MWIAESPWPPMIVCGVIAAIFLIAFNARGKTRYLIGVGVMAVLAVGVYFLEQALVTESERVEAAVFGVCDAFRRKDPATLDYFSATAPNWRRLVERAQHMVDVGDDLRITDVQIRLSNQQSRAVAHFRANATIAIRGMGQAGRQPSRWELTWQREGDDWKIVNVVRMNPINGEPMGILDTSPN